MALLINLAFKDLSLKVDDILEGSCQYRCFWCHIGLQQNSETQNFHLNYLIYSKMTSDLGHVNFLTEVIYPVLTIYNITK
jgi:hypothetical protein